MTYNVFSGTLNPTHFTSPYMGSGRGWLAGDWPSTGAFSTLLRQTGLRATNGGVLATKSERKMLASTCLYSLYAWFDTCRSRMNEAYYRNVMLLKQFLTSRPM